MDNQNLSEEDIKRLYITKALEKAGWKGPRLKMEYNFTAGRVIFDGEEHDRQKGKRADYFKKRKAIGQEIDRTLPRHSGYWA